MSKIIYLCPITRKGYDNPIEPRLYELYYKPELTQDEIFEYCALADELEALEAEKKITGFFKSALTDDQN